MLVSFVVIAFRPFTTVNKMHVLILFIAVLAAPDAVHARSEAQSQDEIVLRNSYQQEKAPLRDDTTAFETLFSHVRSVPIKGTNDHPVFDVTDLAVRDRLIVVLDRESATLTAFDLRGQFLYQAGRPGRAPGEFTNPFSVEFDHRGRLAVLEGGANQRIQFLSPKDGRSLDVLTEDITVHPYCDDVYFEEGDGKEQRVTFVTRVPCTSEQNDLCLIQQHNVSSGNVIRRFAKVRDVQEKAIGLPWVLGKGDDGRLYVSHQKGPMVSVYREDGSFVNRFDLGVAKEFERIDRSGFPDKYDMAFAKQMGRKEKTLVRSISVVDDDVIVDHLYKTGEYIDPMYISIFKQDGTYVTSTPKLSEANRKLVAVQDNRFFFLETNRDADVGSYVVHEYRYTGVE